MKPSIIGNCLFLVGVQYWESSVIMKFTLFGGVHSLEQPVYCRCKLLGVSDIGKCPFLVIVHY